MREMFYVINTGDRYIVRDKNEHRTITCTSNKEWLLSSFRKFIERYSFIGVDKALDEIFYQNNKHDKRRIKEEYNTLRDESMERELDRIIRETETHSKDDGIPLLTKKTKAKKKIVIKKKKYGEDMIDFDIIL